MATAFIVAIGNIDYYVPAVRAVAKYYRHIGMSVHIQIDDPGWVPKNRSRCIYTIMVHRFVKDDFILKHDLDLLPTGFDVNIRDYIDPNKINMCIDGAIEEGVHLGPEVPPFRYNFGLLYVPPHRREILDEMWDALQSDNADKRLGKNEYGEQYTCNQVLLAKNEPVHELPYTFNKFWEPDLDYSKYAYVHYTNRIPSEKKLEYITKYHPKEMIGL